MATHQFDNMASSLHRFPDEDRLANSGFSNFFDHTALPPIYTNPTSDVTSPSASFSAATATATTTWGHSGTSGLSPNLLNAQTLCIPSYEFCLPDLQSPPTALGPGQWPPTPTNSTNSFTLPSFGGLNIPHNWPPGQHHLQSNFAAQQSPASVSAFSPGTSLCPYAPQRPRHNTSTNHLTPESPFPSTAHSFFPSTASALPSIDSSNDYFAALAAGNFSPAPLLNPSHPHTTESDLAETPKPLGIGEDMPPGPSTRSGRRASPRSEIVDLTKDEPTARAPPATLPMPQLRARSSATPIPSSSEPNRKRRGSSVASNRSATKSKKRRTSILGPQADAFAEKQEEDEDTVDLSNASEIPKDKIAPKVDNRIKLGAFNCVICMDDVTALTITHCGHLFCSECLHSSLHIDSNKKCCPVCRTKVDLKDKRSRSTKSFYHLELKVLTKTKMGKRPMNNA